MNAIVISADEEEAIGEFQVAEYIVFLLALDTYMRYAEETSGQEDIEDQMIRRGLRLLRMADSNLESVKAFIDNHLPSQTHKTMLNRAVNINALTTSGASRRALQFRTLLSRGGATTMKGLFENARYVRQVREAISASMLDDADRALDVFAAIPMKNVRLRDWIDDAAKQAGSGDGAPAPVDAASATASETDAIVVHNIQQAAATGAEESQDAQEQRSAILGQVERDATDAARRSLEVNQQPDDPPTRSEVVGVATAAAVAALSDPARLQNVPAPLRDLDDEQRAAALTEGRVVVGAGAGAGKSTTLVSRIEYLVREKRVNPARIVAVSFNRKAANELKEKVASKLGKGSSTQIDTMHALFAKLIVGTRDTPGFGTPEEQAMLRPPRLIAQARKGERGVPPASLSTAIRGMWEACSPEQLMERYGYPVKWIEKPPKAKKAGLILNKWRGNDVGLAEARAAVTSIAEAQAYVWYDMYMGIKGDTPGWKPPCPSKPFDNFMGRYRKGGERLGDLDDMLKVMRDILKRDPAKKRQVQGMFDHILVDEAQDLNTIQHQIFEMMSEHIAPDGSDGRSIFMIGDEKQAIYQFRGAKPELFQSLYQKEGWTTKSIRTNYRCQPEIVEAANRLIANDTDLTPFEARPDPKKDRGRASIQVSTPEDNTEAAIDTIGRYRKDMDEGADAENFAVLARTNAELNDFETACIINEIPYIRRGGRGFLEAPESRAVLGYMDLASGNDYEKMKKSLVAVLTKPDRSLFLGQDDIEKAVDEALDDVARRERVDIKAVRPDVLLESRYVKLLADKLKQPYRLKIIGGASDREKGEWMYGKRVEELAANLSGLSRNVRDLRDYIGGEDPHTTDDLLNYVLDNMTSEVTGWDRDARRTVTSTTSLRDQITNDVAIYSDDDGDEDEDEDKETPPAEVGEEGRLPAKKQEEQERKGLGAVRFLYELAKPNQNDQVNGTDPSLAKGFVQKVARYSKLAEALRIDPVKWEKAQQTVEEGMRREKPPAVTLSTVHCSPPDEPILTTEGWVPIGDLDPERHKLASYVKICNQLVWGQAGKRGARSATSTHHGGYPFVRASNLYTGDLVVVRTARSVTRVTPNHTVLVRFSSEFMNKYVVYLMRRGDWWRVGHCTSAKRPYVGGGVGGHLGTERADAGWILGVYSTKAEALAAELEIQGEHGIPSATFEAAKGRMLTSAQLQDVHERTKHHVGPRALALLKLHGLDSQMPLYVRGQGPQKKNNFHKAFQIKACNILGGFMEVPVIPVGFKEGVGGKNSWTKPDWLNASTGRESFKGLVYSLTVVPHHYYVSGGAVVHNSVKGAQWRNVTVLMPKGLFPMVRKPKPDEPPPDPVEEEARMKAERNLAYVALTRAAVNLEVVCPLKNGVSPFVHEAGLTLGENVPKPGEDTLETVKQATAEETWHPEFVDG